MKQRFVGWVQLNIFQDHPRRVGLNRSDRLIYGQRMRGDIMLADSKGEIAEIVFDHRFRQPCAQSN